MNGHNYIQSERTDGQTVANSIVPLPHFVRRGTKKHISVVCPRDYYIFMYIRGYTMPEWHTQWKWLLHSMVITFLEKCLGVL